MIAFRDFAPRILESAGWFQGAEYENFEQALAAANKWISAESIRVMHVETVVLPNLHLEGEEGTKDPELRMYGGHAKWNQFIRVWYEA